MNADPVRAEIDDCEYLYLRELHEPQGNALRVVIEEAKPNSQIKDKKTIGDPIESDASCRLFELIWNTYVAYSVRNEQYTVWDDKESWQGRLLRHCEESKFRNYVASATIANDEYPGRLQHWSILCLDHIIDVISAIQPSIHCLRPL